MIQKDYANNYNQHLVTESKFWDSVENHLFSKDLEAFLPKEITEYMNESFTDSKDTSWWEYLKNFGPYQKGLSLGCGIGYIEKKILDMGTCHEMDLIDISDGALKGAESNLNNHKCKFIKEDINLIKLPENQYDFILANASFHHFINLEQIAFEINKALKKDGIFVIYDYIGEKRIQWEEKKIKFVNHLLFSIPLKYRFNWALFRSALPLKDKLKLISKQPVRKIMGINPEHLSPFEAIRSDETIDILNNFFEPIHLREMTFIFLLLMANQINLLKIKDPSLLNYLCDIDRSLSKSKLFKNSLAFGIYKKKI